MTHPKDPRLNGWKYKTGGIMSFNLNNFVNYLDQVKDKDWVDDHVIINGVSPEFQKKIKDKIRERLKEDAEQERKV